MEILFQLLQLCRSSPSQKNVRNMNSFQEAISIQIFDWWISFRNRFLIHIRSHPPYVKNVILISSCIYESKLVFILYRCMISRVSEMRRYIDFSKNNPFKMLRRWQQWARKFLSDLKLDFLLSSFIEFDAGNPAECTTNTCLWIIFHELPLVESISKQSSLQLLQYKRRQSLKLCIYLSLHYASARFVTFVAGVK
jgi:hypothetical protein